MEAIRQEKQLFKQNYLQTRKTVACGGSGFQICVSKDWIAERNKRPKLTQTPHAHRLATLIPRLADSPMFAAQLLLQEAQHPGECLHVKPSFDDLIQRNQLKPEGF